MMSKKRLQFVIVFVLSIHVSVVCGADDFLEDIKHVLDRNEIKKDICVVLGLPKTRLDSFLSGLVNGNNLIVYLQSNDLNELTAIRKSVDKQGLLGTRVFVEEGGLESIHLASNLAGAVFVSASMKKK